MGCLLRFRLPDGLVEQYENFVETGVGRGVSLSYAAEHKFKLLSSIEYDERLLTPARRRFSEDDRVRIVHGDSSSILGPHLRAYPTGSSFLFWLDAHWPGGDYFGEPYVVGDNPQLCLPLKDELQAIADAWDIHGGNFVIIIDDISSMMMLNHGASYLFRAFAETHETVIYRKDEGYAVVSPRGDGPRPDLIEQFDIYQLVSAARRYIEHDHWTGAHGFYGQIMALTDGGMDPPDASAKRVGRGEAAWYFAAGSVAKRNSGHASDLFIQAMIADPLRLDCRMDFIYQVLLPTGQRELALHFAKQGTAIFPGEPRAWAALVETNRRLGNKEDAISAMAQARKCRWSETIELLGAQLAADLADFEESHRLYDEVIRKLPARRGEALVGRGVALARDGRFEEAIATFEQALDAGPPDPALCKWNRAEVLLTLGRYAEGWPDHGRRFEAALMTPGINEQSTRFRRPMWEPDMDPCRILVQGEQGYGDVICMSRYLPMLRDMGHDVRMEVDQKLLGLFQQSPAFDGIKIVPRALDYPGSFGLDDFDVHVPSMCFPAAFGTTTDTVPWNGPYLQSGGSPRRPMLAELGQNNDSRRAAMAAQRPKIGLCWSSGRRDGIWEDEYCNRKSVPREEIDRLIFGFPSANRPHWHLFDFPQDRMKPDVDGPTFADTAAILATCDLLITVDTGIAHLAGAMGMPVWLICHGPAGSWHWMCDRAEGGRWAERSPWYPSVRLFRQSRPHEWSEVIDRVRAELETKIR